jgi:putative acetyltransferase
LNGEQIKIRPLRQDDFERLNEIRVSKGVFENILALDTETLAETIDYFTDNSNPKSKYTYIAEKRAGDQQIVAGYIRLLVDKDIRRKHKGRISIAVAKEFQSTGIGGMLFDYIINLAQNWLMLKKLELTVLVNNTKAVNLYKAKGFEIEGTLKGDTVVNGKYEDVYIMGKFL